MTFAIRALRVAVARQRAAVAGARTAKARAAATKAGPSAQGSTFSRKLLEHHMAMNKDSSYLISASSFRAASEETAMAREDLASTGGLRVGINMRNPLLVTGRTASGDPDGLAPKMGDFFAALLDVPVQYVPYDSPGNLIESAAQDAWDVAMIGADPLRATHVTFTAPYCEIEATYVVPDASSFKSCAEVDSAGVRIAVCAKAAYDLWLERNIGHATVERAEGHDSTYELFRAQNFDALAGLRPKLLKDSDQLPNTRMLPGKFMAVEQAACTKKSRTAGFDLLSVFIEDAKRTGLVQSLMEKYGVERQLVVSPLAE